MQINDLPKPEPNIPNSVLFVDDTIIVVTNHAVQNLKNDSKNTLRNINEFFRINKLSLNFDKIYYFQFMTNIFIKLTRKYSIKINKLFICIVTNFLHYSSIVHYRGIKMSFI